MYREEEQLASAKTRRRCGDCGCFRKNQKAPHGKRTGSMGGKARRQELS